MGTGGLTINLVQQLNGFYRSNNKETLPLKSAATGKEHKVFGLKVDGFCGETKEIFEFHGCFYHGCTKCYLHGRNKTLYSEDNIISMNLRYAATLEKLEKSAHLRKLDL